MALHQGLEAAWVRSLTIEANHFNLEAEGADSIRVLENLRQAARFFAVTFHQAVPSPIRGDHFTISGRFHHE